LILPAGMVAEVSLGGDSLPRTEGTLGTTFDVGAKTEVAGGCEGFVGGPLEVAGETGAKGLDPRTDVDPKDTDFGGAEVCAGSGDAVTVFGRGNGCWIDAGAGSAIFGAKMEVLLGVLGVGWTGWDCSFTARGSALGAAGNENILGFSEVSGRRMAAALDIEVAGCPAGTPNGLGGPGAGAPNGFRSPDAGKAVC
jgi:hypothetical protein